MTTAANNSTFYNYFQICLWAIMTICWGGSCTSNKGDKFLKIDPDEHLSTEIKELTIDSTFKEGENMFFQNGNFKLFTTLQNREVTDYYAETPDGKPLPGFVYQQKTKAPAGGIGGLKCKFCVETPDGVMTCVPVPCPRLPTAPTAPPTTTARTVKGTTIIELEETMRAN